MVYENDADNGVDAHSDLTKMMARISIYMKDCDGVFSIVLKQNRNKQVNDETPLAIRTSGQKIKHILFMKAVIVHSTGSQSLY